ncbi:hypothetical protein [uncultured Shewanella sp.]|uniref:hypothetical protein n=1 Tax=uncultured Shewanella sp. TaxID=173975 RepID=UPI0026050CC9|nr:hypothetical protein [uncultured Shewanella sp.]
MKKLNNVKVDGIGESADKLAAANHKQTLISKSNLAANAHPSRQPLIIFTAPADSDVARVSQHKTIKDMQVAGKLESGLQKIMPGLLLLELWNLQGAIEVYQDGKDGARQNRDLASLVGAGLDTLLTFEQVLALINQKNRLTRMLAADAIPTGRAFLLANTRTGTLLNRIALSMARRVSASYALGVISGVLTVGVYIADMMHEWNRGNKDSAIANGVAALCAAGSTGALIAGAFSVGLAMPVFWVLFVIGGIAAGLAVWLSKDDVEMLLINGPLGLEPNKSLYGHLHQPNEAYYRLVSYLNQPQLELTQLSDHDLSQLQPLLQEQGISAHQVDQPNRRISVKAHFPNWFKPNDYRLQVRLIKETKLPLGPKSQYIPAMREEVANFTPVYQETALGLDILLHKPVGGLEKQRINGVKKDAIINYQLQLKLQLIAQKSNDDAWVFPAPKVEDTSVFSNADYTPNFGNQEQAFWLYKEWA